MKNNIKICPHCDSTKVIIFDADNDYCQECKKWFTAVAEQHDCVENNIPLQVTWKIKPDGYSKAYPIGSVGYITWPFILTETIKLGKQWTAIIHLPGSYLFNNGQKVSTEEEAKKLAEEMLNRWLCRTK